MHAGGDRGEVERDEELVALEDGYRESEESWASALRDLRGRGLRAPAVAIGDGALGFWSALRDVWPETTVQRDWCHKLANVLDKLPKRLRSRAKRALRALRDIMYAPTKADAERDSDAFVAEFEPRGSKGLLMAYNPGGDGAATMVPAERGASAALGPGRRGLRRWRHPDGLADGDGSEGGRLITSRADRPIHNI